MQGARPKASLDGLPGLATRPRNRLAVAVPDAAEFGMHGQAVRARKNIVPTGSARANAVAFAGHIGRIGRVQPTGCTDRPFAHQVPGPCIQHGLRNVGGQIIRLLT